MTIEKTETFIEHDIVVEGTKVGTVELCPERHEISRLVIFEPYQNKGYGTQVVKELIVQGYKSLWVRSDNSRAIHVYEKCGFEKGKTYMFEMVADKTGSDVEQKSDWMYSIFDKDKIIDQKEKWTKEAEEAGMTLTEYLEFINPLKQDPYEDAISRQAAINAMVKLEQDDIDQYGCKIPEGFDSSPTIEALNGLPSVTPQPKIGHWIDSSNGWMCSECNKDNTFDTKYCPNCGCRMESKVEEFDNLESMLKDLWNAGVRDRQSATCNAPTIVETDKAEVLNNLDSMLEVLKWITKEWNDDTESEVK